MTTNSRRKTGGKARSVIILILIAVIVFGFLGLGSKGIVIGSYRFNSFENVITKGLDLQGGVSVALEIVDEDVSDDNLQKTLELINMRVNSLGVAGSTVSTEGNNRIRVDVPGMYNSQDIVDSLSKTGKLTFKDPNGNEILTGSDVTEASVQFDEYNNPVVALTLNSQGTEKFAAATEEFYGKIITIYMDDESVSTPTVNAIITDGQAIINGMKSTEEAKTIAGIINSGALPLELTAASIETVGAQLGSDAFPNAIKAGIIGILLVFLFMILFYRVPGLLASVALSLFISLVILTFIYFDVTITLAGIAGLLLTIGMAVDANVLIFERIKEEIRNGKSIRTSVDSGFHRALSSIMDGNITTIIAGVVLFTIGTGEVKGFALTLMIGIVISMFTAIVVTRTLIRLALNAGILNKPKYFGVKGR